MPVTYRTATTLTTQMSRRNSFGLLRDSDDIDS